MEPAKWRRDYHDSSLGCYHGLCRKSRSGKAEHRTTSDHTRELVNGALPERCDEAALVHWVQDTDEPPSGAEAHRPLQGEGRRWRVRYPSEAQRRFEIREPRVSAELVFG